MNTYRVTFAPLHDIDNIQRTPILANSAEEVPTIFGDCVILDIEEQHAVELASALDLDPQAEARETERDIAWVGEMVEHPTYDQIIAGAKFTDQHRADLRKWWNEKYKDKESKKMEISKALTWDELANEYDKSTGGTARTKRMESIFEWAKGKTDVFYVDPTFGTIHKIISAVNEGL